jgi:hypothetical protein
MSPPFGNTPVAAKGGMPQLKPVQSANVAAIGYDPATSTFFAQWHNGKVSAYSDVPASTASDVEHAPSIGRAIHANLKGKYNHRYLED